MAILPRSPVWFTPPLDEDGGQTAVLAPDFVVPGDLNNGWNWLPDVDYFNDETWQYIPTAADPVFIPTSSVPFFGSLSANLILVSDSEVTNYHTGTIVWQSNPGSTAFFSGATLNTNSFYVASASTATTYNSYIETYGGKSNATLQSGSHLTASIIEIGTNAGDVGNLVVTGSDTWIHGNPTIRAGVDGAAGLRIEYGATVQAKSLDVAVNAQVGITDVLSVNNATLSVSQAIHLGYGGTAQATFTGENTLVSAAELELGSQFGSRGTLRLSDGATLELSGAVSVGSFIGAYGNLILEGGTLSADGAITVHPNGLVEGGGSLHGNLINSGQVLVIAASLDIEGNVDGSGSFFVDEGGELTVNGNVTSDLTIGDDSILELAGIGSGDITFDGTNVTLKISGVTMPTGVISGFDSDDTIDLSGVPFQTFAQSVGLASFEATGSVIYSTKTSSGNHLVDIQIGSNRYELQFAPSNLNGAFYLTDDGHGGTALKLQSTPVTDYYTGSLLSPYPNPYGAVVPILTNLNGGNSGTGFIIGPHSILTAAHVVKGSSVAGPVTSLTIYLNGTSYKIDPANIHVDPLYDPNAPKTDANIAHDFAVINVPMDLTPYGAFSIQTGFLGGVVNVTGYPGQVVHQYNYIENAVVNGNTLIESGDLAEGASGGPLWTSDGAQFYAVGIHVAGAGGAGNAVRLTPERLIEILSFQSLPIVSGQITGKLINNYISGATVFSDDNNNGRLDPTEVSTTTDATGSFTLDEGTGLLVAIGGVNTSTGLAFKGQLSAPSGSSVITPLTTLMALLSSDAEAEQKVLSSFGLSSSIDLNSFDPVAAALAGSANGVLTEVAHAKVYDTVSLIASTLVAAGGTFSDGVKEAFAAIAAAIGGSGISLTNEAQVSAHVVAAAQADGLVLGQGVANSVAAIIVASNTLLDQQAQSGATGDELLNAIAAIERVVQGTASNAIQQAGNDPDQLQALVDAFSGENLDDAVSTALGHLGVADTTAPTLTPIADQTNEATSAAGATAFFATTGFDNVDGAVPVVFKEGNAVVHSGDVFGLGRHTITASTIDAAGNISSDTFEINVVDTTGPTLAPIADQVFEATSASGAVAFFAATATDAVDGTAPVVFNEGDAVVLSGDTFSFGTHTITASAVDAAGNQTSQNFKFNVVDTTAPTLTPVANQTREATSAAGAAAFFAATATDLVDGFGSVVFKEGNTVVNSGDIFGLGTHLITASTTDAAGNISSENFTINVQDTTAPTLIPIADQTLQATNAAGAPAFFTTTASDLVDGTNPVVFKEGDRIVHSGDIFEVGVHTITASVVDAAGNSATDIFEINVIGATSHNHDPVAIADSNGVAKGKSLSVSANKGVLSNDRDADNDHLSVGSVNGSAANVGHSIKGDYGTLTMNADGSYFYAATAKALPSKIFAQDTFTYTNVDGHGGSDTATLTFSVYDASFSYKAGSNTILWGDNGKNVLDGSAGHDILYGGNGADVLIGGKGDILAGGKGADQFVFRADFGANTILDFDVKNDHLQFDDSIFNSVKSILDHTTNTPLGALISDGHGDSVLLLGVNKSQLLAHSNDLLIA